MLIINQITEYLYQINQASFTILQIIPMYIVFIIHFQFLCHYYHCLPIALSIGHHDNFVMLIYLPKHLDQKVLDDCLNYFYW